MEGKDIIKKSVRKSLIATVEAKALQQEIETKIAKLKDTEEIVRLAKEEEIKVVNEVREKIDKLCEENNLKCELRITKKDVLKIIELFIDQKEESIVKVNYGLYYLDTEDDIIKT